MRIRTGIASVLSGRGAGGVTRRTSSVVTFRRLTRSPALALLGLALGQSACQETGTTGPAPPSFDVDPSGWEWATEIPGEVVDDGLALQAVTQSLVADTRSGVVLPAAYATQSGTSGNVLPLSWPNFYAWPSIRYQQVFLGSELGGMKFFKELCFRLNSVGVAGIRIITMKLGSADVDYTTMSRYFDQNYSSAPVTVMSEEETPIDVEVGGGLQDFYPCFPFSTVYVHAGGNLVVEMQLWPVGDGYLENRPFTNNDACNSSQLGGCTTARLWGINANSAYGSTDPYPYGLIMKLIAASAEEALQALIDQTIDLELQFGIEKALSGPLGAALSSLANDRPNSVAQLEAFKNQVEGLRGTMLTDAEADALRAMANALIEAIKQQE